MSKAQGVYMFMGVNGVGKSTVVDVVANGFPEALTLHGSRELRKLFGGVTREELERLSPDEKLQRRADHFLGLFRQASLEDRLVLMDTHLLVPIRNEAGLGYENTWVDEYSEFVSGAYMLTADPIDIRNWRQADEIATGRKRDLSHDHIAMDQELNVCEFTRLLDQAALPIGSGIFANQPGTVKDLGARIIREEIGVSHDLN